MSKWYDEMIDNEWELLMSDRNNDWFNLIMKELGGIGNLVEGIGLTRLIKNNKKFTIGFLFDKSEVANGFNIKLNELGMYDMEFVKFHKNIDEYKVEEVVKEITNVGLGYLVHQINQVTGLELY